MFGQLSAFFGMVTLFWWQMVPSFGELRLARLEDLSSTEKLSLESKEDMWNLQRLPGINAADPALKYRNVRL